MENHTQKFKVRLGLFIAGGLAVFVLAVFIIGKQKNLFDPVITISASFLNVSGLQVGNNVRFSGINVGTVDNISIIDESSVEVKMLIRKEIQEFIKQDSKVGIGSEGLIGDRLIIISQGSPESPVVMERQMLESTEPVETDAIIASLQVTAGSVEIVSNQLAEIMVKINSGQGTLGRLISDTIIAQKIDQTIINLMESSGNLQKSMEVTGQKVPEILSALELTATNTENITEALGEIVNKINRGEGSMGRLVQDTILAGNLAETMVNLKNSSKGLDENMEALKHNILFRRYFKKKAREENANLIIEEK